MRLLVISTSDFTADVLTRALRGAGFEVDTCDFDPPDGVFARLEEDPPDVLVGCSSLAAPVGVLGPALAYRLRAGWPDLPVVFLADEFNPRAAMEMLQPAPRNVALLLTSTMHDADMLVDAIRRAAAGEAVLDPALVAELLRGRGASDSELAQLTAGERDVLALMAEGRSNAGIARRLFLSTHTVEKRVSTIFGKLRLTESPDDNRRILAVLDFLAGSTT